MNTVTSCALCGGATVALESPHPLQSMLSDGRILQKPLRKVSCSACGACSHGERLSEKNVRSLYGAGYTLAATAPAADSARGANYAAWICNELAMPRNVLEVGCGSGALLRKLAAAWHDTQFLGFDPAAPSSDVPRITLKRGFLEIPSIEAAEFDLIIAVNVIEHSHDPAQFLASLALQLTDDGALLIICPAAAPNVELLFFDHLWTLTSTALASAAQPAGLYVAQQELASAAIGDFQMLLFRKGAAAIPNQIADQTVARQQYLRAWLDLDIHLAERVSPKTELRIFGAGQAAALIRAYAPKIWQRAECLVLDETSEAWALDKPVRPYNNRDAARQAVLIATAARVQGAVAQRLTDDGFMPIRWDDLISH